MQAASSTHYCWKTCRVTHDEYFALYPFSSAMEFCTHILGRYTFLASAILSSSIRGHDGHEFPTAFLVYYTIALKPTGHESTIHSHDTNIHSSPCPFSVFASPISMPSSVRLHCTAQIVVSPSHGRQESHISVEGGSGCLEKAGLPRSPIVRPGITDSQDRNAVEDVVVTMKAMHGCMRMRHGRQDERTSLRRKSLQRGYI